MRGTARARVLDAAERLFAAGGYEGTSMDQIAAEAGVTKGAIYWSFDSKEELFFALVDERVDSRLRELMSLTERAPAEGQSAPQVSRGVGSVVKREAELVLLLHEYWALAVRDPRLRRRFVRRQRQLRDVLAKALEARHEATGVALSIPSKRLATALIALGNGLTLDRLVDPSAVPDDLYGEMLSLVYDGLVHRAERSGSNS